MALRPPIKPMLAKAIAGFPDRSDVVYEPKWDGFRCIIFRDGGNGDGGDTDVVLGSRNSKPLTRYFPEMLDPVREQFPAQCVVDGELIVATTHSSGSGPQGLEVLDFEALQQRIHPAESRVQMLAESTPAQFVAFDLLALGDDDLRSLPFSERRVLLEQNFGHLKAPLHLTKVTADRELAAEWFSKYEGAGLDGLIAKPIADPYQENKRAQLKIKHVRSADVVVAGYRWHKDGNGVGSLLLGLYSDDKLQHVGVAASFTAKRRAEMVSELEPLIEGAFEAHPWREWADAEAHREGRMPGAPNRWSGSKDHRWVPLRIERVVEVKYNSTLNGRFRGVTKLLRWRGDKTPIECDFAQLDQPVPVPLSTVLG